MSAFYEKLLREAAQQRALPKRRLPNGGLPSRAPDRVSNRPPHPACAGPLSYDARCGLRAWAVGAIGATLVEAWHRPRVCGPRIK